MAMMTKSGWIKKVVPVALLSFFMISCGPPKPFVGPQSLGGEWISAANLNQGWEIYNNYCMSCHGIKGDGKGPAAFGAFPPPRDFTTGLYKFGTVEIGDLPTDDDFKRIIRHGLRGTPMLPWDLSDHQLNSVIQYIKTFSPVWNEGKPGTAIEMSQDPYGELLASEAIAHGKKIYHGVAQCWSCHPSYATVQEVDVASRKLTGMGVSELRDNPHIGVPADSEYKAIFMPPDFTKHWIRSGYEVKEIYQRLSSGVNGTVMAPWKGALSYSGDNVESDRNQWALAYYLRSLQMLKFDHQARKSFMDDLNARRAQENSSSKQ